MSVRKHYAVMPYTLVVYSHNTAAQEDAHEHATACTGGYKLLLNVHLCYGRPVLLLLQVLFSAASYSLP